MTDVERELRRRLVEVELQGELRAFGVDRYTAMGIAFEAVRTGRITFHEDGTTDADLPALAEELAHSLPLGSPSGAPAQRTAELSGARAVTNELNQRYVAPSKRQR